MDYLELTLEISPRNPWTEIVTVALADAGYESFVETETGVLAYAQVDEIDINSPVKGTILESNPTDFKAEWRVKIIPQQNWNAVWESDFQPVEVENYATIVAPFHDKTTAKGMVVEILPKMSFGTGHHQTTWMMTKALFELENIPFSVLDMGTGTGVLAIVAEKLGAQHIVAVDIEDWSVENTLENAHKNACSTIHAIYGDIDVLEGKSFGLILANINKNVLKRHLVSYALLLEKGGVLLLSGFFESDVDELLDLAMTHDFRLESVYKKDNWAAIKLTKN